REKLVAFIRYLSLFILVVSYLKNVENTLYPVITMIILFLIIINNQVRFFSLSNENKFILISYFLELILIFILCNYTKTFNSIYFVPLILDISFLIKEKYKYILFSFVIISSLIISLDKNIYLALESSSILLIITVLSIYIENENLSKLYSQNLYDKLRISKDELKKVNADLETYASSIEELAILKERNRISREIHDSVGHSLSTTIIQLNAIEKLLKDKPLIYDLVHELREFVTESFQDVRRAISELKPVEYENYQSLFKIKELVKSFIKLTNINVKLTISKNTWNLSRNQSIALYRLIQESLSNSSRHGKATEIRIFITFNTSNLIITISDNGIGCGNIKKGNGLNSINERIYELNGKVEFDNSNNGFTIRASFPKFSGGDFFE
ncbi:TPA: sensor histidine kinase, partial [Clostridioides difficile]